jgi:signal transduction histidine kinase/ligand-binding sensor protein
MVQEKWPYAPDSIFDMLPGDLRSFLQTGATHAAGRAVVIVDPINKVRAEAIERFDRFEPFCRYLREDIHGGLDSPKCDNNCKCFGFCIGRKLLTHFPRAEYCVGEPVCYRCYLGLEEWAVPISIGGVRVIAISGQFLPPEGLSDIKVAISCLGVRVPELNELTSEMQKSMIQFSPPADLWLDAKLSQVNRLELLRRAESLPHSPAEYGSILAQCAGRIAEIAHKYYKMKRTEVEGKITRNILTASQLAMEQVTTPHFWDHVVNVLEELRSSLSVTYIAFFSGLLESDTILRIRVHTGEVPCFSEDTEWPHFNWRKASLYTCDGRDTSDQTLDWKGVCLSHKSLLLRGLKGDTAARFNDVSALIPVRLPNSPRALLMLGPSLGSDDLESNAEFMLATCRDVATRMLTMYLADILKSDRSAWQRTAQITGHRVRASIQNIDSQMSIINASTKQNTVFSLKDAEAARAELDRALEALIEVSYAAESEVQGAVDTRVATREPVNITEIIEEAVESQQHLAMKHGINIEIDSKLAKLPPVYGNRALLRYVFMNLINNGLKYSYYIAGSRTLRIKTYNGDKPLQPVEVEVVNYGLGVKPDDSERIFEWGVRLVAGAPDFEETFGKGFGLWECRHVVEEHGGVITVESIAHDKSTVRDENINKCITVFRVSLPQA